MKTPMSERLDGRSIPEPNTGCRLWIAGARATPGSNYGTIWFRGQSRLAHRVAWELAHGPVPQGMGVLHRCDTPSCINVRHLFLGSQMDNVADMIKKGRARRGVGERHGAAKLSAAGVAAIRILAARTSMSMSSIARMFGVSWPTVASVAKGETWGHVPCI